jgi:hypothetical protein
LKIALTAGMTGYSSLNFITERFFIFPGTIAVRLWSGYLSHEKDRPMRGLDFRGIRPKNYF